MTLQSQNNRINYTATGDPATDYSFPFWVAEEGWVKVAVDGEDVSSSDYTVDLPNSEISFVDGSEPVSGKTITIYREVTLDQQTDYTPNGPFPAESHEQALDKLTAVAQELEDGLSRAFRANVSEDGSLDLEVPAFDENKALTFKMVSGNQVIGVSDRDPDKAQDESEAARDAAQAAQTAAETAESNAEGHENGAQTAESGAVTAKDEAETARDKAQDWAEGTEPGGTGTKSAKDWAATARMTGVVEMWPFSNEPSGWVFVDGRTIGDTGSGADHEGPEFEPLFDMLKAEGSAWGNTGSEDFAAGDTVKLPDGRDRSPLGENAMGSVDAGRVGNVSTGLGDSGGEDQHTLTMGEMPSHDHGGGNHGHTFRFSSGGGAPAVGSSRDYLAGQTSDGADLHTAEGSQSGNATSSVGNSGTTVNSEGGDSAHNNMHPFFSVNYIMKV